ncbi:MAG: type II toxin-antitoxin system prevent-host-death family antitoxin [Proteobacteria bacterium]|nr:type II toxin-antitoxin system prevent-host-death family antitoxin [Pseudomonadota bacterium]
MEVGAFEAKTHLSSLLDRVSRGEEIVITKHGRAVARLVPATQDCHVDRESLAQQILKTRQGVSLGADWKSLRDQGRK